MGLVIQDGSGRGFFSSVSESLRLNVSSKSNPRIFYVSRDDGLAFVACSNDSSAAAGDYIFYLKNTSSTRNLFIERFEFHSVEAVLWKLWEVTGTASGTSITASNLNLGSGLISESTCYGNGAISGLSTVKQIGTDRTQATGKGGMEYGDALILPPDSAIAVEYDTGTTGAAEVDCFFHFENISRRN